MKQRILLTFILMALASAAADAQTRGAAPANVTIMQRRKFECGHPRFACRRDRRPWLCYWAGIDQRDTETRSEVCGLAPVYIALAEIGRALARFSRSCLGAG